MWLPTTAAVVCLALVQVGAFNPNNNYFAPAPIPYYFNPYNPYIPAPTPPPPQRDNPCEGNSGKKYIAKGLCSPYYVECFNEIATDKECYKKVLGSGILVVQVFFEVEGHGNCHPQSTVQTCHDNSITTPANHTAQPTAVTPSTCGANERWDLCPCVRTCADRHPDCEGYTSYHYQQFCYPGCVCQNGWIRNGTDGGCIREHECSSDCTDVNEILDSKCRLCEDECGKDTPTCETSFYGCDPKCKCRPGWARNDTACIPKGACSADTTCGSDQYYFNATDVAAGTPCAPTCIHQSTDAATCEKVSISGCYCNYTNGYYYDERRRTCVKQENCTCLDPNEEYQSCGSNCPATCDEQWPNTCAFKCVPGCFCRNNYVRNAWNKCVLPKDCPAAGPPGCVGDFKYYHACKCLATCADPWAYCAQCSQGCFCYPPYVLDQQTDQCVLESQCSAPTPAPPAPGSCGQNEVYTCGTACTQATCDEAWPVYCSLPCIYACYCAPNYVRNAWGECVLLSQCSAPAPSPPAACGQNEVYTCGTACTQATCEEAWPVYCSLPCIVGCYCRENYVRNAWGECVPLSQCSAPAPPTVCRQNEAYTCGTACAQATCDEAWPVYCSLPCIAGCYCLQNYVRNAWGECVLLSQCNVPSPPACASNEVYDACATACPATCIEQWPPVYCSTPCAPGCTCINTYVRDAYNRCVHPSTCLPAPPAPPSPPACPANEEYQICGSGCPSTCYNRNSAQSCSLPCQSGCFCRYGYVRNAWGECVHPNSCPQPVVPTCYGQNEEYLACGTACPATCDNRNPSYCTYPCTAGCFCRSGYLRNSFGQCVLSQNCPQSAPTCSGQYEIYRDCGPSCVPSCANPLTGACPYQCAPGCYCKAPTLRNAFGQCVLPDNCPVIPNPNPPTCSGRNEVYESCGSACVATCLNPSPAGCASKCVQGCFCRAGYVRDSWNDCILIRDCPMAPPRCTGANQVYKVCGSACVPTCADPSPAVCTLQCLPGCFCSDGYVLSPTGDCILRQNCPAPSPPAKLLPPGYPSAPSPGAYVYGLAPPAPAPAPAPYVYVPVPAPPAPAPAPYAYVPAPAPPAPAPAPPALAYKTTVNKDDSCSCQKRSYVHENSEYVFFDCPQNFDDAEQTCVDWKGHLASIGSRAENDWIQYILNGKYGRALAFWIGLRRDNCNTRWWYHTDNFEAAYFNWYNVGQGASAGEQPNCVYPPNELCVHLYDNQYYVDSECTNPFRFICERPVPAPSPPAIFDIADNYGKK